MLPDRVSNPGPLTYESGALPIALRGPANRLGGLSLPRKSTVRVPDCPDMTLDVYRGRKTTIQQYTQQQQSLTIVDPLPNQRVRTIAVLHI